MHLGAAWEWYVVCVCNDWQLATRKMEPNAMQNENKRKNENQSDLIPQLVFIQSLRCH